jgi:hypothetical protein
MSKIVALAPHRPAPEAVKPPWVDIFTEKVGQKICDEIAAGKTLSTICREAWCAKPRQVHIWMAEQPDFREAYEESRKVCADHLAREIVELADNAKTDLDMAKLPHQIHAREWVAQRMDPARYGDRKQVETHSTIDANVRSVSKIDLSRLSSEELLIAEKALMKAIGHDDPTDDGLDED